MNPERKFLPGSVRRWLRRRIHGPIYSGDYASWAEAAAASEGYDAPVILEKTLAAARAVRDGRAAWDRDTVTFPTPEPNEPLLAALRASVRTGRLNIVDFGGALGSTWWQHRTWLADVPHVRWSIVEQANLVEAGRREFAAGPLAFYDSLAACVEAERPDVILLSSVLPYLESPHTLLEEIRRRDFASVIIDRTGFTNRGRDRLTVQRVPRAIYSASYPCWFFDREQLLRPFAHGWRVAAGWRTDDVTDIAAEHGGIRLEKAGAVPSTT